MKVTAQMRTAGGLAELALALQIGGIELGIALVAIGLKNAAGLAQMAKDMVFLPVRGELIDRAGRGLACPRALIADVSPDPPLPDALAKPLVALAAIEERTRMGVSSAWSRSLAMISASIFSISGARAFIAPPHQSTSVVSGISAPIWAKISFCL